MRALLLAGVAMFGCVGAAHADVITTFSASGVFSDGSTFGGTLTLDTTNGKFVSAALTASDFPQLLFTNLKSTFYAPGVVFGINLSDANGDDRPLLAVPFYTSGATTTAALGYNGGSFSSSNGLSVRLYPDYYSSISLTSGSLTPIPEPATLALLGLGLTGIMAVRRQRAA